MCRWLQNDMKIVGNYKITWKCMGDYKMTWKLWVITKWHENVWVIVGFPMLQVPWMEVICGWDNRYDNHADVAVVMGTGGPDLDTWVKAAYFIDHHCGDHWSLSLCE